MGMMHATIVVAELLVNYFVQTGTHTHTPTNGWTGLITTGTHGPRVGSGAVRIGPTPFPDRRS